MTLEERARLAAQTATRLGFDLHGAEYAKDRDEKRRLLTKAFQAWPTLSRHMSELERLAPNCAQEGYAEAARISDFVEARAG
jgi:hypothetical protein